MNYQKRGISFLGVGILVLITTSCATNARIDFTINHDIDNQQIFDCTLLAIEQHNQTIPKFSRIPKSPYYAKPFQNNIIHNDIQKGELMINNHALKKNALSQYPLQLYRTKLTVLLKSYSPIARDHHLQTSLITLSEKIQQCLPEAENINTPKKEASIY